MRAAREFNAVKAKAEKQTIAEQPKGTVERPANTPHTPQSPPISTDRRRGLWSRLKSAIGHAYKTRIVQRAAKLLFGGIIGTASSILTFYPKLSVDAGSPLDASQPFSSVFQVNYDGPIPLYGVQYKCMLEDVKTTNYYRGRFLLLSMKSAPKLMLWGDSESVFCPLPEMFSTAPIADAKIFIVVEYNPIGMPFLKRGRGFKFITAKQKDGNLRWIKTLPVWDGEAFDPVK